MYHVGVTAHLIQPSGFATCIFPQEATIRLRQAFYELPENVKEFYGEKTIHSGKNKIESCIKLPYKIGLNVGNK